MSICRLTRGRISDVCAHSLTNNINCEYFKYIFNVSSDKFNTYRVLLRRRWCFTSILQRTDHVMGLHSMCCIFQGRFLMALSARNAGWAMRPGLMEILSVTVSSWTFVYCNPQVMPMVLTHWGRDKIDAISLTTFSNGFSWIKMYDFRLKFHWIFFLAVKLTIFQHWFRKLLGADQATSHYLNSDG